MEPDKFPKLAFISPNLCHDGHSDCKPKDKNNQEKTADDQRIDEMDAINNYLPDLVKQIEDSTAYKDDGGLIIITFDEAEVPETGNNPLCLSSDEVLEENEHHIKRAVLTKFCGPVISGTPPAWAKACCGEEKNSGPGSRHPGFKGPGGGRVGAILISPLIQKRGVDCNEFNHYSLLKTLEDLLLSNSTKPGEEGNHLGYAGLPGLNTFQACGVFDPQPLSSVPTAVDSKQ